MPATLDAPHFLTVQEAAALLRVNPRTIRNRIRAGKLAAKTLGEGGRALLLDQRDVLGMLTDARPEDVENEETS